MDITEAEFNNLLKALEAGGAKKEDIEKINRVRDVFNAHSLNFNELTCQKDLTLFNNSFHFLVC